MLGLTFEKLVVIALIAVVVIGPQRLPGYAERLAAFVRSVRDFAEAAKIRAEGELGVPLDGDQWSAQLRQYDPRRIVRDALAGDEESRPVGSDGLGAASAGARQASSDTGEDAVPGASAGIDIATADIEDSSAWSGDAIAPDTVGVAAAGPAGLVGSIGSAETADAAAAGPAGMVGSIGSAGLVDSIDPADAAGAAAAVPASPVGSIGSADAVGATAAGPASPIVSIDPADPVGAAEPTASSGLSPAAATSDSPGSNPVASNPPAPTRERWIVVGGSSGHPIRRKLVEPVPVDSPAPAASTLAPTVPVPAPPAPVSPHGGSPTTDASQSVDSIAS